VGFSTGSQLLGDRHVPPHCLLMTLGWEGTIFLFLVSKRGSELPRASLTPWSYALSGGEWQVLGPSSSGLLTDSTVGCCFHSLQNAK
jgi:hypothetical protein